MLKTFVETDEEPFRIEAPEALPGTVERYLKPDAVDWSWRIYPSTRTFPFVEMEYTLPLAEGPAAMREIRRLMQTRHPDCAWAVEYRTQPGEQSLLSPTRGIESVTISLHQAMPLPYEPLFRDAESVFRAHDGRPHWGKLHFLSSDEIAGLYPELPAFQAIRAEMVRRGCSRTTIWRGWDWREVRPRRGVDHRVGIFVDHSKQRFCRPERNGAVGLASGR